MTITRIVHIGTYSVPYLLHSIASSYNVVDQIVVGNSGRDFPWFTKTGVPIENVNLKEIDYNGKIYEVRGGYEKTDLARKEIEGCRSLGIVLASEYAARFSPDWILQADSDQVFYNDLKNLNFLAKKENVVGKKICNCYRCNRGDNDWTTNQHDGFQFLDYKDFYGNEWHALSGLTDEQQALHADGAKFYMYRGPSGERQRWAGQGGIVHYRAQRPTDLVRTAHLRDCVPALWNKEINWQYFFLHQFSRNISCGFDSWEIGESTYKSIEELIIMAYVGSKDMVSRKYGNARRKPPEIFEIGIEKYIREGYPK